MPRVLVIVEYFRTRRRPHTGAFLEEVLRRLAPDWRFDMLVPRPVFRGLRRGRPSWYDRPEDAPDAEPVPWGQLRRVPYWNLATPGQWLGPWWFARRGPLQADYRVGEYALVHAHWAYRAGYIAALIARRAGVPLVITCHGSDVLDVVRAERSRDMKRPVLGERGRGQ